MSITNREGANKYYKVVNELIDEYIEKNGIRPSRLKKYLKKGSDKFEKFVNRNGLKDIKGIHKVIEDVIEDICHMEKDGVLTFERYKFFESNDFKVLNIKQCLYKGVGKTDIKSEKIIADIFDANLSDIDIIDSEKHLFKVRHWEKENNVIIYSKDELDIITENIKDYLLNQLLEKEVDVLDIKIKVDDLVDNKKFEDKLKSLLTDDTIINFITKAIGDDFETKQVDGYFLWIK